MSGALLASKYAFPPNRFGYCGRQSFRPALAACLSGRGSEEELEAELKKFHAHYAYLALIARENGMRPFDMEVVRAFWIGNRLLEGVSREALTDFILRDLFPPGKKARARKLADSLPEGLLPHHSFNALYVNFVTNRAERTIRNIDSCCVNAARVLSSDGRRASVERTCISFDKEFCLSVRKDEVSLEEGGLRLIPRASAGDAVSVHWGMAVERLKRADASAIARYTRINLSALNRAEFLPALSVR